MPKMVQVPIAFLEDIRSLLDTLKRYDLDNGTQTLCGTLERVLATKEAAMQKRETFSAYKNSTPGTDGREDMRHKYLDSTGMHKDWRTDKEISMRGK